MRRASIVQDESDIDAVFLDEEQDRTGTRCLSTRRLSEIEPKPISWLWPGRIPRGKLTMLAGNPGLGKSQITANIAGIVTTGGRWPVDGHRSERGDVLFLSAEDDAGDTLRPRLEAAGADLTHIHLIEGVLVGHTGESTCCHRLFSLVADLEALSQKLSRMPNAAVLVIDPISAYLGHTDSHKNAEVRGLLAPLGEVAAQHNIGVIGISHLTKAPSEQALMRVSGSLAFVAAARAAYLVAPDQTNQTRRLFVPLKNNLGPDGTGLAYRIEPATMPSAMGAIETSRIVWEPEPIKISADDAIRSAAPETSALKDAEEWLQDVLVGGQSLPAKELIGLALDDGISERTLRRAADNLRIKPKKEGRKGPWSWALPAEDSQI